MTTEKPTSSSPAKPRIVIALPESSPLRDELLRALHVAPVDVETYDAPDEEAVGELLADSEADVVVVRRAQLPTDPTSLENPADEAAGLVVVTDRSDPVDRVELLAAGASRVIDADDSAEVMGSILEAVARSEAAGGPDGPEIRGNDAQPQLTDFLSRSESMRRFLPTVKRVANADASLLITGETGVGKERLARAIHAESERRDGPFVSVNCGAIPEQLLESQLFGHEKGAFTGADKAHRGFFEQASAGTIFLDEIGELPQQLQVKLLTALQRHEVQRLGTEKPVHTDVRVIAATNRDLRQAIDDGDFREDLFYRLNVISLEVPPLRERRKDIPDLAGVLMQYFRNELRGVVAESISEDVMHVFNEYAWPGNVRELINVIERAMLLCDRAVIERRDLPVELLEVSGEAAPNEHAAAPARIDYGGKTLKDVRDAAIEHAERQFLDTILRETSGRVNETAKRAGIGARALYDKMRRYGLRKEDYKRSD